ncbi:Hypothetical predicted protein [Paramuricea clavata]|uniref:Uncharacterized protein n=1 Tax=Paramuricea clavata TaxID=317549 RepID=A0A6S7KIW5_PARCT|nr:Hypothetical predicted protein [Paramuricea clavata]
MGWRDWDWTLGYAVVKTTASVLVPGLGIVIGGSETAISVYRGNNREALINGICTAADAYLFGMATYAKDAAKTGGKNAAILLAKSQAKGAAKEGTKEVGRKLAKNLAMGIADDAVKEAWKKTAKSRGIELLIKTIKDGKIVWVEEVTEEMIKKLLQYNSSQATKTTFDPMFKAVFTTAVENEFKKYSSTKVAIDLACTGFKIYMKPGEKV